MGQAGSRRVGGTRNRGIQRGLIQARFMGPVSRTMSATSVIGDHGKLVTAIVVAP
jgi:hypothetical protein